MLDIKRIFSTLENLPFSWEAFENCQKALIIMLKGMTSVFIFMLSFFLIIKILEKLFNDDIDKEKK
ncbi:MAG: OadG family protein [Candidatus Cloacimonetes bacterium]|nr:OadG family protein [Candidatus Cloacimonadota bacterium]